MPGAQMRRNLQQRQVEHRVGGDNADQGPCELRSPDHCRQQKSGPQKFSQECSA